ncbi:cyclic nucleotide-binding domain-containing protein [Nocardioides sp. TF02-7]|uniref:cyclic nucleotide-binding domain-containing protein n=1 Tax=Nocardioides sp. TF02-7 TaxID=2917724 RepID=UPI001F06FBAD|nr:cyclic nucleotide-binding domain-containing protein [Nocardioides sp. TF02-7]UMG94230.1 cyclic nucleotide-binding domain-containing protein [Nocardioides sp. TF02-7]
MADARRYDAELARVPLFAGLSGRQRSRLLDKCKVVEHQPGTPVTTEGAGSLAMHLVLSGAAEVDVRGRKVRDLGPGDYFGEISMIDGKPRSATVTAQDGLTTLAVPHLAFTDLVEHDPSAAKVLLVALCARLREAEAAADR